jgi:hypothetical protein
MHKRAATAARFLSLKGEGLGRGPSDTEEA